MLAIHQYIPDWDPSYEPFYFFEWSDYEEGGWEICCVREGKFYLASGGHSVMADPSEVEDNRLYEVTPERALEALNDWLDPHIYGDSAGDGDPIELLYEHH